ncbi:alkane hydroxylase MAH1-like [Iris pallida]|uniref:noroxomaritidine synthase n=1 Tax=Iris pallida TaxID=29817 RepID=A0AAX6FZ83_IRIPA|nr:alkane hydroxylase MAH1-like [Iris pallida]
MTKQTSNMDWKWQANWCYATIFFLLPIFFLVNRNRVVPLRWPVIGMLPSLLINLHRLHDFMTSLLKESGGTFMFEGPWFMGMDMMITCDPTNAKHMFTTHFSNYIKGPDFPEIFDILGDGIITADGDNWSKQRKMANAHMSSHNFRSSVARNSRDKVENAVLPLLGRMADLDRVFDLQDFMKRFAMDLVSKLVLGKDPSSLAEDFPMVPFVMAVGAAEEVLFYRHVVPKALWKLLRWLDVGEEKKMTKATNVIDGFIAQCIDERRNDIKNRGREESKDILTSYMYHILDTKEDDSYFGSDRFLRDTLMTLLAAGTDSSAAALSWFFWQVSKCPNVEKKILEELKEVRSSSKLDVDGEEEHMVVFDAEVTEGLVYLHAALCETLRLYPSFPFNHKTAFKEDVLPSGHRVRPDTMVLYSIYSTGRLEKFFGKDCLEFKPERWIDPSSGQLKHVSSHDFLAFHTGQRSCIGRNMAMTQMKVIAAAMIYNFRVELVESCAVEPKNAMVLLMKNGLHVKIRKREGP